MLSVTAIVPATDAAPALDRARAAIQKADEGPEELLVVREPPGAGPAAARNAGARAARGELLVFIDSDVMVHADAFTRIRAAFDADPRLTALFGAYDDCPAAPGAVSGFRNLLHHYVHTQGTGAAAQTFWAGLGAVRRDAFLAIGGFDEQRYPGSSIEDIELGGRLAGSGARIELDPALRGTHLKAWTLRQMIDTDLRRRGIPWVTLLLNGAGAPGVLNLGPRHRASLLTATAAAGAAVVRRPALALACGTLFVWLNRRFYSLLLRRRGPVQAALGVPLHVVHYLTGAAALLAGTALWARERFAHRGVPARRQRLSSD